nr:hypothetical protein [Pseudonocardia sp.]
MLCTGGFTAAGGVRIRRMEARKSVQFVDATLGTPGKPDAVYALNAYGPETPELVLRPAGAPAGRVRLARAQVGTFADAESLWAAAGGVDLDDFAYRTLHDPRGIDVRARLRMLEHALPDFVPGPYEQLAAAYRQGGDEELSEKVLLARQRRRYAEAGPAGRVWGALQHGTVGFGYRPWTASGASKARHSGSPAGSSRRAGSSQRPRRRARPGSSSASGRAQGLGNGRAGRGATRASARAATAIRMPETTTGTAAVTPPTSSRSRPPASSTMGITPAPRTDLVPVPVRPPRREKRAARAGSVACRSRSIRASWLRSRSLSMWISDPRVTGRVRRGRAGPDVTLARR